MAGCIAKIVVHSRPVTALPELPRLTAAACAWTREIEVTDAEGEQRRLLIPQERALVVYIDKQEVVTLMTLGQRPELLVLGYLYTQGLIDDAAEVESISVDWDVSAAAVRMHRAPAALAERLEHRIVTTGCGQGSVLADTIDRLEAAAAGATIAHDTLCDLFDQLRRQPSVHRDAGSVHGTALACGGEILFFVEDVGRHNAVDTIAGWMLMNGQAGADKLLCTTGRLTSEMVQKAARLAIPIVASRNGVTAMGHELAERLNLTLIGRASGRRYLCYTGAQRIRRPE